MLRSLGNSFRGIPAPHLRRFPVRSGLWPFRSSPNFTSAHFAGQACVQHFEVSVPGAQGRHPSSDDLCQPQRLHLFSASCLPQTRGRRSGAQRGYMITYTQRETHADAHTHTYIYIHTHTHTHIHCACVVHMDPPNWIRLDQGLSCGHFRSVWAH